MKEAATLRAAPLCLVLMVESGNRLLYHAHLSERCRKSCRATSGQSRRGGAILASAVITVRNGGGKNKSSNRSNSRLIGRRQEAGVVVGAWGWDVFDAQVQNSKP